MSGCLPWWKSGIVYEVYPRSFMDSDGDGNGDLAGIRDRLDYLAWLGVDSLWICPFYPSPMEDGGYDIADYRAVDERFGTLADFDRLIESAHRRGLRVILDLVPNHTSHLHPWFRESRASRSSGRRDWYLWRDPGPGGGPPNNWLSEFGGSAWEFDEATGQYYYHAFLKEQPDLNWRNPEVRRAFFDVMRFWLDRGADGFRVDVMWHLIKDARFRDNPPNPRYRPDDPPNRVLVPAFSANQPEVHEVVREMREVVDEYRERVLLGEIYLPIHELVTYYGHHGSGANLPYNFQLIVRPWKAEEIFRSISVYEGSLPEGAWPDWVLGNHDKPRVASRLGPAQARVAAALLLTLRGTPTLYYGDEIGMEDVLVPPDRVRDGREKNVPGRGLGRDPARTPMQWSGGRGAGFTSGEPWLPVPGSAEERNVERERADPRSLLLFYRDLIALRRSEEALTVGDYDPIGVAGSALAYLRSAGDSRLLVAANLSHEPCRLAPARRDLRGTVVFGTHSRRVGSTVARAIELDPDEAFVARLG